jgi:hypothetical protein
MTCKIHLKWTRPHAKSPVIGYEPNASYGIRNQLSHDVVNPAHVEDCLAQTENGPPSRHRGAEPAKSRFQIWRSQKSSIDPRKPMIARGKNGAWAQNGRFQPWRGPSKNGTLLKTLHLAGREPRQNQHFKSKQRGDPYQPKKVPEMKGGVPSPIKVTAEPAKPLHATPHSCSTPTVRGGAPAPPVSTSDVSQSLLGLQGSIASRSGRVEDANCRSVAVVRISEALLAQTEMACVNVQLAG